MRISRMSLSYPLFVSPMFSFTSFVSPKFVLSFVCLSYVFPILHLSLLCLFLLRLSLIRFLILRLPFLFSISQSGIFQNQCHFPLHLSNAMFVIVMFLSIVRLPLLRLYYQMFSSIFLHLSLIYFLL